MARLGADGGRRRRVGTNIEVAKLHAARIGLKIDYRADDGRALADAGEKFDVVLNMEVVEHVADVDAVHRQVRRDGEARRLMFVATINRTLKALGLAIVGAEYVLRWLPRGTHQFGKAGPRPDELEAVAWM
jgi:2-polyprenyl-6-hydroxyphenyl methylase/3-demethylubiquinone-9 3-methyltransferase